MTTPTNPAEAWAISLVMNVNLATQGEALRDA